MANQTSLQVSVKHSYREADRAYIVKAIAKEISQQKSLRSVAEILVGAAEEEYLRSEGKVYCQGRPLRHFPTVSFDNLGEIISEIKSNKNSLQRTLHKKTWRFLDIAVRAIERDSALHMSESAFSSFACPDLLPFDATPLSTVIGGSEEYRIIAQPLKPDELSYSIVIELPRVITREYAEIVLWISRSSEKLSKRTIYQVVGGQPMRHQVFDHWKGVARIVPTEFLEGWRDLTERYAIQAVLRQTETYAPGLFIMEVSQDKFDKLQTLRVESLVTTSYFEVGNKSAWSE